MTQLLDQSTDSSFEKAKRLYKEGANAKPYAVLQLQWPLDIGLKSGQGLVGETSEGVRVSGTILGDYERGASQIAFLYKASVHQCTVGASSNPTLRGCLQPAGSLAVVAGAGNNSTTLSYTYYPRIQNMNRLSLQKFSLSAKEKMHPFKIYSLFVAYYGNYSYADHWIKAAFKGDRTDLENGNANFRKYGYAGRSGEAVSFVMFH